MDTEDPRGDRLKFVVAIMTKDYSKAIDLGASILRREPNDHRVRNCVAALRKIAKTDETAETQERSLSDKETSLSNSGTEESDETDSGNSSSEDDEACDRVIEASSVANDAGNVCQSPSSPRTVADCVREAVTTSTGSRDVKLLTFREKMYRVLPLKFARKK